MQTYKVTLRVNTKQLPVLVSVIEGTPGIELVTLSGDGPEPVKRTAIRKPANWSGDRAKQAEASVMEALADGKAHPYWDLGKVIAKHGYATTSISPFMSRMKKRGLVVQGGKRGTFRKA